MTDQLVPNYVTEDPVTGKIGANFTGLINAEGVVIPAGSGQETPELATDQIVWQYNGGAYIANIQGWKQAVGDDTGVRVTSQPLDAAGQNYAMLAANTFPNGDGSHGATLQISQNAQGAAGPPGSIGEGTEISAFVGAFAKMLLDSDGRSSFVQLDTPNPPAQIRLAFFGAVFTWSGSSGVSNTQRFFNGFTNGPGGFLGGAQGSGIVFPYLCVTNWGTNFVDCALVVPSGVPSAGFQLDGWLLAWGT